MLYGSGQGAGGGRQFGQVLPAAICRPAHVLAVGSSPRYEFLMQKRRRVVVAFQDLCPDDLLHHVSEFAVFVVKDAATKCMKLRVAFHHSSDALRSLRLLAKSSVLSAFLAPGASAEARWVLLCVTLQSPPPPPPSSFLPLLLHNHYRRRHYRHHQHYLLLYSTTTAPPIPIQPFVVASCGAA